MEYINENDNRVSAALHITEVLKRCIFMLDEVVRGVANELENKIKEPLKYSQIFGKIAQSKTVGENHEPIDLC